MEHTLQVKLNAQKEFLVFETQHKENLLILPLTLLTQSFMIFLHAVALHSRTPLYLIIMLKCGSFPQPQFLLQQAPSSHQTFLYFVFLTLFKVSDLLLETAYLQAIALLLLLLHLLRLLVVPTKIALPDLLFSLLGFLKADR